MIIHAKALIRFQIYYALLILFLQLQLTLLIFLGGLVCATNRTHRCDGVILHQALKIYCIICA